LPYWITTWTRWDAAQTYGGAVFVNISRQRSSRSPLPAACGAEYCLHTALDTNDAVEQASRGAALACHHPRTLASLQRWHGASVCWAPRGAAHLLNIGINTLFPGARWMGATIAWRRSCGVGVLCAGDAAAAATTAAAIRTGIWRFSFCVPRQPCWFTCDSDNKHRICALLFCWRGAVFFTTITADGGNLSSICSFKNDILFFSGTSGGERRVDIMIAVGRAPARTVCGTFLLWFQATWNSGTTATFVCCGRPGWFTRRTNW
jgi:hypothetical protein